MSAEPNTDQNWSGVLFQNPKMLSLGKTVFAIARHPSYTAQQKQNKIKAEITEEPLLLKTVISQILSTASNLSDEDKNILCCGIIEYLNHLFSLPEGNMEFPTVHQILNAEDFYLRCGNLAQIAAYNLPRDSKELLQAVNILVACAGRLVKIPSRLDTAVKLYIGAVNNSTPEFDIYPVARTKLHAACRIKFELLEGKPSDCWDFFTDLFSLCDEDADNGALLQVVDYSQSAADLWIKDDPEGAYNGISTCADMIATKANLPRISRRPMPVDRAHTLTQQATDFALKALKIRTRS